VYLRVELINVKSEQDAQLPCNDNQIQTSYDTSSDRYHSYKVENEVCSTASPGCTRDLVFTTMVSQVQFIAPTSEATPVTDCKITILDIPGPFGEDSIRTSVNQNQYSITNYTRKDHALHPGLVTRTIIERNDKVIVVTFGEDTGRFPGTNEKLAPKTWTGVDNKLIEAVSCPVALQSVRAKLQDLPNLEIASFAKRDISKAYSDYPKERPDGYSIDMRGNQVINLLNSPQLMTTLASQIIDNCKTVSLVSFGLANTDYAVLLGLMPNGNVQQFECLEPGQASEEQVWGKKFCF